MPDISTPNLDYGNMVQAWDINDALMGGTLYMRELGETYLPRWPKEDKEDYKKRLAVATLLPAYEETINQNVGRVFAEPIQLGENVPDQLREFAKNVDLEGTRLDVWAQSFFSLAMQYGLSHALVDYPRVDTEQVKTKADEKATGARPYVTMLNPRQVIGWKSRMVGGKVQLTALRIKEVVVEDGDDFGQTKVEQIRLLTPGKVQIFRKSTGAEVQATWALHDEWQTSRRDITLVTLYTKRTGFMCGSPPLLNMALLNVKHWQSQSEQDNILHVVRVPILSVFGLEEGQELIIGSSSATSFSDRQKQGMEYTEHTGSAIGAGKDSLTDLVEQMRQAGAKLLRTDNTSTKSVDQTSEEKMQEQSPLYTMATSLEDAIDNILQIMAEYIGEKDGGSVDVRTELDVESKEFNPPAALAIQALRQGGDIRRVDAIKSLQKLNIIDADADPDVVLSELLTESASLTEPPTEEV
ncbi:DUF4055 domain-containing protein [Yokenella regensburgei]|uniref:DUF4055 domain-containing protein n=1 Tax=Yokenella regensburgei TaxID=158877 RepID=UPI003F159ECC